MGDRRARSGSTFDPRRKYRAARQWFHPDLKPRNQGIAPSRRALETAFLSLDLSREECKRLEEESRGLKEKFARSRADMDNLRKRARKEQEDARKFALQSFVEGLIPVLDSFDQALANMKTAKDSRTLAEGLQAIYRQLENALKAHGLERVDAHQQPFDPHVHEALAVEKTDKHPNNTVIQVLQHGYLLHGRLVRPARVRIAQRPDAKAPGSSS